jgi:DNA-binding MarR family transcriptional regulator
MSTMLAAVNLLRLHIDTLKRAAGDARLDGAPLKVYVYLNHELDLTEFRPVKVRAIANELHLKMPTTSIALRRLVETGYIQAGPKVDRVHSYRLLLKEDE